MKRISLKAVGLPIVAAFAAVVGGANAVELSADGMGQVLLYPYYTVNAGNSTLLSVVNTTRRVKVIKVRFMEAYNGADVLTFNLFLSPYDVWTANLFALTATGTANLLTDDDSCTVPDIKGAVGAGLEQLPAPDGRSYVPFRTGELQIDGGPRGNERTREGHFELMEMGTVAAGSPIEAAVIHTNGVPAGCTGLTALVAANTADIGRISGGLFGSANIVNPQLGTLIGYNADAIDGFHQLESSLYVANPSQTPNLASARTTSSTVVAHNYVPTSADGPNQLVSSTYSVDHAIDAVSSIFTANVISNEYVIEAASASESEWVVNFPTKRFYVNSTAPTAPFSRVFAAPGQSCVIVGVTYNDREVREVRDDVCNPCGVPPITTTQMCYQTQVLTFQRADDYIAGGGVSAVLGSKRTVNVDPRSRSFASGWLRLDMSPVGGGGAAGEPHALRVSTDLDEYQGLPVTGFLATNYLNRNNGGPNVLSTYSTGSRHRAIRRCVKATTGPAEFCS